jgi:hypothetical protein
MAENGSLGNSRQEMLDKFTRIPGLGRSRAEVIYDAGYTNLGLLRKASVDELTKIPGVGISLARCIKNNIGLVKDEPSGEISVSPIGGPAAPEPGKIILGETPAAPAAPAQSEKKPESSAPAPQSKTFFASMFEKILGKPAEKAAASKKEDEKKEGVKVEPRPQTGKEEEKKGEVKVEGNFEQKKGEVKVESGAGSKKGEGQPGDKEERPPAEAGGLLSDEPEKKDEPKAEPRKEEDGKEGIRVEGKAEEKM